MFGFHGLLWFGLLAVLVPLLHLIRFRREVRRDWAAISLLDAAVRKASRRAVPLQWGLVILRTALIACMVLLFASPGWDGLFPSFFRRPVHHVIILDDSASVGEIVGQENLFARQRETLRRYVSTNIAASDQVTLWRLSRWVDPKGRPDWDGLPGNGLTEDMLSILETLTVSDVAAGPALVLSQLDHRLGEVDPAKRERLVWVGDFRAIDWNELVRNRSVWTRASNRSMSIQCLFSSGSQVKGGSTGNLAVRSVTTLPGIACVGLPLEFEVSVSNESDEEATNIPVSIRVDGIVVPGFRIGKIPARSRVTVKTSLSFSQAGTRQIEFILEPDALACDNVYYETVRVGRQIRVLLAVSDEGQSQTNDRESVELAKTITAALNPGIDMGITTWNQNVSTIDRQSLDRCNLVVLCGYRNTRREFPLILKDYVIQGGNAVFIPTQQSDWVALNSDLGAKGNGMLPWNYGSPVFVTTRGELKFDHWTTRVFTQCDSLSDSLEFKRLCPARRDLVRVQQETSPGINSGKLPGEGVAGEGIGREIELEGAKPESSRIESEGEARLVMREKEPGVTTIKQEDRPLMVIAPCGKGSVSQCFFSPLAGWSNLSSHLSYPILWRDLVAWLCRPTNEKHVVGEPLVFSVARLDSGPVYNIDYSFGGMKESLGSIEFVNRDGTFVAELNEALRAGFYALSPVVNGRQRNETTMANSTNDLPVPAGEPQLYIGEPRLNDRYVSCFAVNVDPKESALETASSDCLRDLERLGVKCRIDGSTETNFVAVQGSFADTVLILLLIALILWELRLSNLFYGGTGRRQV